MWALSIRSALDTEADATHASYPTTRQAFEQELDRVAAAQPEATFMLAGATAFVNSTAARLKAHGVNASQLKRDTFYGYTGPRPAGLPGTDDVAEAVDGRPTPAAC